MNKASLEDSFMGTALKLARRAFGQTSPNPMVGALLVKGGKIIGRGWHHRAGDAHAEIEALRDAERQGYSPRGATLFVTLEPCSTHGRTPPCTDAIISSGIKRVIVGATDPNPAHAGRGFTRLERAGIGVTHGVLGESCRRLNESFNHWIVHQTPLVTVKAAMSLDGKIATTTGESKWITGPEAREYGMTLRLAADAILVGINTVIADDPSLTYRPAPGPKAPREKELRRIVLDTHARTPLNAKVVSDEFRGLTTIVVGKTAPKKRVNPLKERAHVLVAPLRGDTINLGWLLKKLGRDQVTHLLVEGGGTVNASFLMGGLAHHVAFFYAPKIIGGRTAPRGVAGQSARSLDEILQLHDPEWRRLGPDLLLTARTVLSKG
jgi:diaminohydroxyphosphoribosylaminopyrimidine deaminase/5-amino-6-(5-phosphoribosylamino)uracil reductase